MFLSPHRGQVSGDKEEAQSVGGARNIDERTMHFRMDQRLPQGRMEEAWKAMVGERIASWSLQ